MTSLKRASNLLEQRCQVRHLLVFESVSGYYRSIIPVVTEHVRTSLDNGPEGQYEFFRARAVHDHATNASFHLWHNQVSITLCHVTKQIKVGPTGQLIMATRGIGLGPALMACVLTWLKRQNVNDYTIDPGSLSPVDARTEKDRLQRNRFYMAFGFQLSNWDGSETGPEVVEGSFTAATVADLVIPDRYQTPLKAWSVFARDLADERVSGIQNLQALKDIDRWTHARHWLVRWLLRQWGWPARFTTRHMHPLKAWESDPRRRQAQSAQAAPERNKV